MENNEENQPARAPEPEPSRAGEGTARPSIPSAPSALDDSLLPSANVAAMGDERTNEPPEGAGIDDWLMRNIAPLLLICASLSLQIVCEFIQASRPAIVHETKIERPNVAAPQLTLDEQGSALVAASVVGLGGLVATYFWLNWFFQNPAFRPRPALYFLDLIAVVAVMAGAQRVLDTAIISGFELDHGAQMAVKLLGGGMAELAALAAGILLARHRGGLAGLSGLWPFWSLTPGSSKRAIWCDIGLGVLIYPLSMWMVGMCLFVNQAAVKFLGHKIDDHPLVPELGTHQSPWVLAVFFVTATLGAAFFEELLFRGILYNVLKRYFGAGAGAALAALLFALAHRIESQVFGLFVLALVLTWLYDRTGRLVAGMTLHALNNLIALGLYFMTHR